ncbi:MAG: esterase/lipase family protein [Burkholderiales bacterium]
MDVVLAHGLWMPGLVMTPLAARLARAGLRCHIFRYAGHRRPLEWNAERLQRFVRRRLQGRPAHYVGHSLGGLVLLRALTTHAELAVGHVVLLGTPAQGCLSARLVGARVGDWMLGASAPLWREGERARWARPEPLGVIAGSAPFGLARALVRLPGQNDGVVRVEETFVEGMRERIVLQVAHSAMVVSPRVAAQVRSFLEHGSFA